MCVWGVCQGGGVGFVWGGGGLEIEEVGGSVGRVEWQFLRSW